MPVYYIKDPGDRVGVRGKALLWPDGTLTDLHCTYDKDNNREFSNADLKRKAKLAFKRNRKAGETLSMCKVVTAVVDVIGQEMQ